MLLLPFNTTSTANFIKHSAIYRSCPTTLAEFRHFHGALYLQSVDVGSRSRQTLSTQRAIHTNVHLPANLRKPDTPVCTNRNHQLTTYFVSAKSDQHINIYSFVVRCDRMWPSTQWHMVYAGSGNVPYVQFESVGDFIPKPRCSKFAVGLQTRGSKMGVSDVRSDSGLKGQEWRVLQRALSVRMYALSGLEF